MPIRLIDSIFRFALLTVLAVGSLCTTSWAQDGGGGDGGDDGGDATANVAGIEVDAAGLLRVRQIDPRMLAARRAAALKSRPAGSVRSSDLRKVSITRLEKAVAKSIAEGKPLSTEMLTLAGLTRIEYVFYFPETKDIVIAGPAEDSILDGVGRPVGLLSGMPSLRLDDLIVALRSFGPDAKRGNIISCSIDPTAEGLAQYKQYLEQFGGTLGNTSEMAFATGLRNALGFQTVTLKGVPTTTHFAQALVEADYRMKLIGIGLEKPMTKFTSWIERVRPSGKNNLQRWFFVANYDAVKVSPDLTVLKLEGTGVKLMAEEEFVSRDGKRQSTGKKADKASTGFTNEFTQKFDAIAESIPVFFEMRNMFDLSVAAAFLQSNDLYATAKWNLGVFADESRLPVETVAAPKQVEPAVNTLWKGSTFMAPIGGGVHISAKSILNSDSRTEEPALQNNRSAAAPVELEDNQWWWD